MPTTAGTGGIAILSVGAFKASNSGFIGAATTGIHGFATVNVTNTSTGIISVSDANGVGILGDAGATVDNAGQITAAGADTDTFEGELAIVAGLGGGAKAAAGEAALVRGGDAAFDKQSITATEVDIDGFRERLRAVGRRRKEAQGSLAAAEDLGVREDGAGF